jgi:hypothetical protein
LLICSLRSLGRRWEGWTSEKKLRVRTRPLPFGDSVGLGGVEGGRKVRSSGVVRKTLEFSLSFDEIEQKLRLFSSKAGREVVRLG